MAGQLLLLDSIDRNHLIVVTVNEKRQVLKETFPFGIRSEAVKPFSAVWLSHLLVEIFLLMHPALVPVFRKEFTLTIFQAGLLITIPSLCRLAIVLPTGIFADKYGSRPFIVLSLLVSGLSALLLSQSTEMLVLLISLSLIMISVTLYHPPGMSVIGKLFPNQSERSAAIGLHGASGCIGQSVGTISLGLLLAQYGWRYCYLLFSIPLLTWAVLLARMKIPQLSKSPRPRTDESELKNDAAAPQPKRALVTPRFSLLLLSMGLNALATGGAAAFMTTYLTSTQNLPLETASVIFGAGPLIGIAGSLAAGYIGTKLGDRNALTAFYFAEAVFLLGLITIPFTPLAALSFLMYQLFSAAIWTPSTSMVASLMGRTGGGTAYSLFYFAGDALGAVSPLIAAILIESLGLVSPFMFAVVLLLSSALLVRVIRES